MSERRQLEFFLLRYVPNVAREEFVNIGLVMTESGGDGGGFAGVHFTANWKRARELDPEVDTNALESVGRDIERRLNDVQQRAFLLHQMMDSYSNSLQLSPIWRCFAENPAEELKKLAYELVETTPATLTSTREIEPKKAGRRWIHAGMQEAFVTAGVWDFLVKDFPARPYTNPTDDFVFDFAYPVGSELKIFQAVSLASAGSQSRMFPLRVAKIGSRMREKDLHPIFMAVVEDQFDKQDDAVRSLLAFMDDEQIEVKQLREMPEIAAQARRELRA